MHAAVSVVVVLLDLVSVLVLLLLLLFSVGIPGIFFVNDLRVVFWRYW